jgi:putative ATP-binding cassette transporter
MRRLANNLTRLTWITSGHGWLALVAPILVASPGYFGGNLSFGGLMMVVGAFFQVQQSLRWFVDNFAGIADWRATLSRVVTFHDALVTLEQLHGDVPNIELSSSPVGKLALENVTVSLPEGSAKLDTDRIEVEPGERILIAGDPHSGKTALILAIAGLWPWGTGKILTPPRETTLFMYERPYLPLGTLRSAVTYPAPPDRFDLASIESALQSVGLDYLLPSLSKDARWDRMLSLDEQQLLAFARLLLHKPKWVFFDDALNALEAERRQQLLDLFTGPLAGTTFVSTSRTPAKDDFYSRIFTLHRVPAGPLLPLRPRKKRKKAHPATYAEAPAPTDSEESSSE